MTAENAGDFSGRRYPMTCLGPMARSSKDLRLAFELLVGADGKDPEVHRDFKLKKPVVDWSNKTVWVLEDPVMLAVSRCREEAVNAVTITAQYFESLGARIRRLRPDYFRDAILLWATALSEIEGAKFETVLFASQPKSIWLEMARTLVSSKFNYTLPALATVVAERLLEKTSSHAGNKEHDRRRTLRELKSKLNILLRGENLLLAPVNPRSAPRHHGTFFRPFDFAMTAIFNALGVPVTVAPVLQAEGLPVGVQLVGAWGEDHVTLSAAQSVEMAFGGWKPPTG